VRDKKIKMKKIITIVILLLTIAACTKDEEIIELTYFELLTAKEWDAISTITYNEENEEIDSELYTKITFLFLKNNDVIIYNNAVPENMLKWQLINNDTAIKLIPYENEPEKIWEIETLTTTDFIISKKSTPTAVLQTKEVATFRRN